MLRNAVILVGAGVACAMSATSFAGVMNAPALTIDVLVNGTPSWSGTPAGEQAKGSNTMYHYEGSINRPDWSLNWNILADPDPFISSNISLTNNTGVTQIYTLIATLPIAPPVVPSSVMGGSAQGGITADAGGGTLSTVPGSAFYRAMIDGLFVGPPADLFVHPTSVTVGAFGSGSTGPASFGDPIPSAPGPAALATIGIQLQFSLTPGDQASFTSIFVVEVPAPGAMGVFAVAGLAATRRRRA